MRTLPQPAVETKIEERFKALVELCENMRKERHLVHCAKRRGGNKRALGSDWSGSEGGGLGQTHDFKNSPSLFLSPTSKLPSSPVIDDVLKVRKVGSEQLEESGSIEEPEDDDDYDEDDDELEDDDEQWGLDGLGDNIGQYGEVQLVLEAQLDPNVLEVIDQVMAGPDVLAPQVMAGPQDARAVDNVEEEAEEEGAEVLGSFYSSRHVFYLLSFLFFYR